MDHKNGGFVFVSELERNSANLLYLTGEGLHVRLLETHHAEVLFVLSTLIIQLVELE